MEATQALCPGEREVSCLVFLRSKELGLVSYLCSIKADWGLLGLGLDLQ